MAQKIFVICPWFDTFAGGAEKALRELSETFVRYGLDVHVLTTCSITPYEDWFKNQHSEGSYQRDGLTVHRFKVDENMSDYHAANAKLISKRPLSDSDKDAFFTRSISSDTLIDYLKTELQPTDRILCGPYYQGLCHNVVRALPGRVHLLPAFHDEAPFYWPAVTQLLQQAAGVFFLSYKEKDLVIQAHGHALGLVYQDWPVAGLPVPTVAAPSTPSSEEDGHILYVGRFDHGKGVPKLCEWHAAYADNCVVRGETAKRLKLVGSGDATAIIEHDSIEVVGYVEAPALATLMQTASALVNLSPNESFSYVIMEAGAAGVPVIVSQDCDVTTDHVFLSGGGWSLSQSNEYAQVLAELTEHPEIGQDIGAQGRTYVEEMYHRDRIEANYLKVLLS